MTFVINVFHLITLLIGDIVSSLTHSLTRSPILKRIRFRGFGNVFLCVSERVWFATDKRYRWWLNRRVGCAADKYNCSPLTTMFRFNWKLYVRLTLLLIRFALSLVRSSSLSLILSLFLFLYLCLGLFSIRALIYAALYEWNAQT